MALAPGGGCAPHGLPPFFQLSKRACRRDQNVLAGTPSASRFTAAPAAPFDSPLSLDAAAAAGGEGEAAAAVEAEEEAAAAAGSAAAGVGEEAGAASLPFIATSSDMATADEGERGVCVCLERACCDVSALKRKRRSMRSVWRYARRGGAQQSEQE